MKKYSTPGMVFSVLIAAFVFLGSSSEKKAKKEITWLKFPDAIARAEKENKIIVADFYTVWCGWCKVMDKKTYGASKIIEFATKKLIMTKVNAESDEKIQFKGNEYTYRQLAKAFGVTGYPSTIFLGPKGEFLTLVPGYIPPEKFLPILEYFEGRYYKKMKFDEFLKKRKSSEEG